MHDRRCWIFDMDGTLTVPVHDFAAIRRELGVPAGHPILEYLADQSAERARELGKRLDVIERELAQRAVVQEGAEALLAGLTERGARLGILTRNAHDIARQTLQACGLASWFGADDIIGRDEAAPKPSPAGVAALLARWGAHPEQAVVVGDFLFDMQAGRAAGAMTVYVDASGRFEHREHADVLVRSLADLVPG